MAHHPIYSHLLKDVLSQRDVLSPWRCVIMFTRCTPNLQTHIKWTADFRINWPKSFYFQRVQNKEHGGSGMKRWRMLGLRIINAVMLAACTANDSAGEKDKDDGR